MALDPNTTLNKIMKLYSTSQFTRAAKSAKIAVKKFPRDPRFVTIAGTALAQSGNTKEAAIFFQMAWKFSPEDEGAQENFARSLIMSNQHHKALTLIDQILAKRPNAPSLLYLKSLSLHQTGDLSTALIAAQSARDLKPDMTLAHNICGVILVAMGQYAEAIPCYEKAISLEANNPDTLANLSTPLAHVGREQDAFHILDLALSINPSHISSLQSRAVILAETGDIQLAIDAYQALISVAPTHAQSLNELSLFQSVENNGNLAPLIKSALAKTEKQSTDSALLNFALANIHWQAQDFNQASHALKTANTIEARRRPYNATAASQEFSNLVNISVPPCTISPTPRPIFIVGLPRSGTSLVEQILSSNSNVTGLGELPIAQHLAQELLGRDDTSHIHTASDFQENYIKRLPRVPDECVAFIDKMPANYRYVGLLAAAFPNATFINVQRDPRDIALSLWRGYFPKNGLNYSYDFKSMAHVANLYKSYMDRWNKSVAAQFHTFRYEDIVADIDAQSRRIADICSLEWSPNMAHPERNTNAIRTASLNQVRAPVHTNSIGNWNRLENDLLPFINALDRNLWPEIF